MVVDLRLVAVGWILAESDLRLVGFDLRLEQLGWRFEQPGWRLVVSDLKSEQLDWISVELGSIPLHDFIIIFHLRLI